jgi:chitin-binding protein
MSIKSGVVVVLSTGVALLAIAGGAFGHGLIEDPPSRNWFCGAITKPDEVLNGVAEFPVCGDAFAIDFTAGYSFMSVLTHTQGRSVVGPRQNVCGFNSETWNGAATVWDQPIDWPTTSLQSGPQTFTWNISWGPHFSDTAEFRYWITRPSFQFQVGQPLSFSDFEDQPFCVLTYDDANPGGNPLVVADPATAHFHTTCTVPPRQGRHVIYAEWGRNQFTFERFHGCIDAVFDGGGPAVEARIALSPDVTEVTGAGVLTLDASGSQGENLSYQWSVDSVNPELYTLTGANQAVATLDLDDPRAAGLVTISLVVVGQNASSSETVALLHRPSVSSPWFDLGPLTAEPRTLAAGDRVSVRTVQNGGQDVFYPGAPLVLTATNAGAAAWPLALGQAVNAQNGNIRIGVLDGQNQVVPAANATANRIYALLAANVTGAFLQVVGAVACEVDYDVVSQWPNGFQTNLTITNLGNIPVVGYTLSWTLGQGESFGSGWNATFASTGSSVSASNTAGHWNGVIREGGGTVAFGFQGVKGSAPVATPTDFRLNGAPCGTAGALAGRAPSRAPVTGSATRSADRGCSAAGGAGATALLGLGLFVALVAARGASRRRWGRR